MAEKASEKPKSSKPTTKGQRMDSQSIGKYAFWVGLILAVIIAIVPEGDMSPWVTWAMLVLGLVGGWLRVSEKSEMHFLLLTLALFATANSLEALPSFGEVITGILTSIATFLGVAVIAVVVRNIIDWFR